MMVKARGTNILVTFLLLLTGCGIPMISYALFGNGEKYDWLATESAPADYPMEVLSGNLRYHGDAKGRGLYVPARSIIFQGWGNGVSTHITGEDLKALPDHLSITYFSYAENTFYSGQFDLPYDKILKLFKEGSRNQDDPDWYHYITVGVAPGGAVSVWVSGLVRKIEIFHGQAEKVEMNIVEVMDLGKNDPSLYVQDVLTSSVKPAALEIMRKHGIPYGLWGKYRTQYNWVPVFMNSQPENTRIVYFNGESNQPSLPYDKNFLAANRTVPAYFSFQTIVNMNGELKPNAFRINFDSDEVMEVFARLGSHQEPLTLEFATTYPRGLTQIRLRNANESITFKKCTIK